MEQVKKQSRCVGVNYELWSAIPPLNLILFFGGGWNFTFKCNPRPVLQQQLALHRHRILQRRRRLPASWALLQTGSWQRKEEWYACDIKNTSGGKSFRIDIDCKTPLFLFLFMFPVSMMQCGVIGCNTNPAPMWGTSTNGSANRLCVAFFWFLKRSSNEGRDGRPGQGDDHPLGQEWN